MAKNNLGGLINRAIQKRDTTRVAVKKTARGAALIDSQRYTISVESDGAASKKGLMFTISGEPVDKALLKISEVDVTIGGRSISQQTEVYKTKKGGYVIRAAFPQIALTACDDLGQMLPQAVTEEQMMSSLEKQIIFRFTPEYSAPETAQVMINIYPLENPIDGSCTEWVTLTSDHEFFEHGGFW